MVKILSSLSKTVHLSLMIAILLFLGLYFGGDGFAFDQYFFSWLFRYLHVLAGIMWIGLLGYLHESMTLGIGSGGGKNTAIGIGMWLGIIMAYNVWFIIWPNQKKALGIIEASAEEKPIAAKKAMLTSRVNTLLSIPMLLTMVAAQNLY